ncbi:hypothetical protein, partial [uncultured Marinobacter sp.]|uniref:hypothetical protein n=1 Tax=uncultured Marinobacter sp. TaxID=187379 RepID=UPI0030DC0678
MAEPSVQGSIHSVFWEPDPILKTGGQTPRGKKLLKQRHRRFHLSVQILFLAHVDIRIQPQT